MLEKTIKQVLHKKINKWVDSIDDEDIKKIVKENVIITGGSIPSMMLNEEPKDYDVYFKTKEATLKIAKYYVSLWNENKEKQENKLGKSKKVFVLDGANPDKEILDYYHITELSQSGAVMISNTPPERIKIIFPSDGVTGNPEEADNRESLGIDVIETVREIDEIEAEKIEKAEIKEYFPVFLSTNAITLSNGIQIVVRFYGEAEKIHETYDFEHTKSYYDYYKNILEIPKKVYECVHNKTLVYTGSLYPVCSIFRLRKFIGRGWKINAGQMLKMCMQISELDLNNIEVLEDQLVGVDSVYFMNLINQFRRKQETEKDWTLTTGYLLSIIDKIF